MRYFFILILLVNNVFLALPYNSENGYWLSPYGELRVICLYINIIYDVTPNENPLPNSNGVWNYTTNEGINTNVPNYTSDFIDHEYTSEGNVHGLFSKLYYQSSLGKFIVLGDVIAVDIKQSRINSTGGPFSYSLLLNNVIDYINENGGINNCSYHGYSTINDYDYNNDNIIDYLMVIGRNFTAKHGTYGVGSGITGSAMSLNQLKINEQYYNSSIFSYNPIGDGNLATKQCSLPMHEFSHSLFGGNEFHTSGGNHFGTTQTNTFMGLEGGYGLMGDANSTLVGCNGYERWRLGWTSDTYNPTGISIQASEIKSDIKKLDGNKTFYLRDFVSTGDAIRIRLPHKKSYECSEQYIWLENHQIGRNNKLDFNQYSESSSCIPSGTSGVYSYIQVGKDKKESSLWSEVFVQNETDNLRILSAEGNYDMEKLGTSPSCLYPSQRPYYEYSEENPFCGTNELRAVFETTSTNQLLPTDYDLVLVKKDMADVTDNALVGLGDNNDAFTNGDEIGISSNPASVNAITNYAKQRSNDSSNYLYSVDQTRENDQIFLSGLNIKFTEDGEDVHGKIFKVEISWNDYDIKNDVRWTGEIVLKEELNLLSNKKIILNQNRTAIQPIRDAISGEFSPTTKLICESNSNVYMQSNSAIIAEEKSSIEFYGNSSLNMFSGSKMKIMDGCTFQLDDGAFFNAHENAKLVFGCGSIVKIEDDSDINLLSSSSEIVISSGSIFSSGYISKEDLSSFISGSGIVKKFEANLSLTNTTINKNYYADDISISNCNIEQNKNIILEYSNEIIINSDFLIETGSTVEIKQTDTGCL